MAGMPIGSINLRLLKCCAGFKNQNCSVMKKIFLLILIIISVGAIHSCKKPIPEGPSVFAGSEVDVYVRGHNQSGKLCYWKNGQAIALTGVPAAYASANSIAVVGSEVYVAGHEWNG